MFLFGFTAFVSDFIDRIFPLSFHHEEADDEVDFDAFVLSIKFFLPYNLIGNYYHLYFYITIKCR